MSYFLPLFFQKRLLRYALSRLELIDTDALDLDNLGIKWGQRSTFEFRDVGLRLEKLSSTLHLPPGCTFTRAGVSLVRVTIPADIYSSGIIIEVQGIDIRVKLLPDRPGKPEKSHQEPGSSRNDDDAGVLPHTADLARSFLESEPEKEKEELQAALMSQSSDAGSDDEELGLDNGVSLPSFVAGFLKGIVNRLQLTVADVSLRVDMEIQRDGIEAESDLASVLCTVRNIVIDSVATSASDNDEAKVGKRMVSFSGIKAMIISTAAAFSNHSCFGSQQGSSPAHSRITTIHPTCPNPLSSSLASASASASIRHGSGSILTVLDSPELHDSGLPGNHSFKEASHLESSAYSSDGRFSDAESEDEIEPENFLGDDKEPTNSRYIENPLEYPTGLEDSAPSIRRSGMPPNSDHTTLSHSLRSSHSSPESYMFHSALENDLPGDEISTPKNIGSPQSDNNDIPADLLLCHYPPTQDEEYYPEELVASRIFTHEEAQSLYQSLRNSTSADPHTTMPGAWDFTKDGGASDSTDHSAKRESGQHHQSNEDLLDEEADSVSENCADGAESDSSSATAPPYIPEFAKEFCTIEKITYWMPSLDNDTSEKESVASDRDSEAADHLMESTLTLDESTAPAASATPRSRLPQSTSRRRSSLVSSLKQPASSRTHGADTKIRDYDGLDSTERKQAAEVEITCVSAKLDIPSGSMLVKIGQKLVSMQESTNDKPENPPSADGEVPPFFLKANMTAFSLHLLERTIARPFNFPGTSSPPPAPRDSPNEHSIFHLSLSNVGLDFATTEKMKKTRLKVSKFVFGTASQEIISFDESLKMRESTRDIKAEGHGDILLRIIHSSEYTTVVLTTLPVFLSLNLRSIDETLCSFGGLSTFLELGSSIASTPTVRTEHTRSKPAVRGVHFADPDPRLNTSSLRSSMKMDCRIGGIAVDVIGEYCTVSLKTTAAKLISRFEGLALQIDRATVSGPHLLDGRSEKSALVDFQNLRFEYQYGPKEVDLDRLLSLLTPSKDKYDEDDDIMLGTLLRQRRQGAVLRLTAENAKCSILNPAGLEPLHHLAAELTRLSRVAKYLPQDDRPGMLILARVKEIEARVHVNREVGTVTMFSKNIDVGYVTFPSLTAIRISTILVVRNGSEELVGEATTENLESKQDPKNMRDRETPPMIMIRFIAEDVEPTVKIKLFNLKVEYTIPFITAILGLNDQMTAEDVATNMTNSVLNMADFDTSHSECSNASEQKPPSSGLPREPIRLPKLAVTVKDCVIGLNPRKPPAKGLIILHRANLRGYLDESNHLETSLDIPKTFVMVIDDIDNIGSTEFRTRKPSEIQASLVKHFQNLGFVPVSEISSAIVSVKVEQPDAQGQKSLDVEVRDDLLVLETCADSTQTLISILSTLAPLQPPSDVPKYRTEIVPIEVMLESLSENCPPIDEAGDDAQPYLVEHEDENLAADGAEEPEYVSVFYPSQDSADRRATSDSECIAHVSDSVLDLDFQDNHFAKKSEVHDVARGWDPARNTYKYDIKLKDCPLRVRVRDVHFIWNVFDGYDWQRTRDTISRTVREVQTRAAERLSGTPDLEEEEESVISDFLFNSVYIGVPATRDPRDLSHDINRRIDDFSETMSNATTSTATVTQNQTIGTRREQRERLHLSRSRHHKMCFEVKGICADFVLFPKDSGENLSSLDLRVKDLEIFDHVPTSTWKKFATYMRDAGEREYGADMVHMEIFNMKMVADLAATELALKVAILPLRLHVDQDALDFLSRFFEFKDGSVSDAEPAEQLFFQRVEICEIPVRLDFKPKRVDYAALRSGRTTEFMNFFNLEDSDILLRGIITHGVPGLERLNQLLNDVWMPDIKYNQLPVVLSGIPTVRPLANIGTSMKELALVPIREYKNNGRVFRSIQKGASQFAKITTNELAKLGAKLAIRTQTTLEATEGILTPQQNSSSRPSTSDGLHQDGDGEVRQAISLYADQPLGVVQGVRTGFRSLGRDLLLTRNAILAIPGAVMESSSPGEAAKAVAKRAPTVVLRPAIGASKAVSQTLFGVSNTIEPRNRYRNEDKYGR